VYWVPITQPTMAKSTKSATNRIRERWIMSRLP
jgi:hypothetical protein